MGETIPARTEALSDFEIANLSNLGPVTVDEAKALIPSLSRFMEEEVQTILSTLAFVQAKIEGDD